MVDNKWVFRVKYNADGIFQRSKVRLVAKGFHQTPGIDYSETFSYVIKASTVKVILITTISKVWTVRQLDINNVFLNGNLHEIVYMYQPKGFEDKERPHHACRLQKALYGLKQALRAWFEKLRTTLLDWGFKNSKCDSSLFFITDSSQIMFVFIYVDDMIVTGNNTLSLQRFVKKLHNFFASKDLGPLHLFMGIEVTRDDTGIYLTKTRYVEEMLKRKNMLNASPIPTPAVIGKPSLEW